MSHNMTDALEENARRIDVLERQTRVLAEAVRALADGLGSAPMDDTELVERVEQVESGARLARELLIAAKL